MYFAQANNNSGAAAVAEVSTQFTSAFTQAGTWAVSVSTGFIAFLMLVAIIKFLLWEKS